MQKTSCQEPPATPADMSALSSELEALRTLLRRHAEGHALSTSPDGEGQTGILAVARLFPGITLEQWSQLAEDNGLRDWLALSLDESPSLNLHHLQRTLEVLVHQSEHDPLTGLMNRRAFDLRVHMESERMDRGGGHLSLAIIDLDNFKAINDTYGHPCGDTVLRGLADILHESKRTYDVAGRIGGEEFALLLPGASPLRAKAMVERVLTTFAERKFHCERHTPFSCTFSAGIASMRSNDNISVARMTELADNALYDAKQSGRNRVHVSRLEPEIHYDRSTMVHSNEKQFLFSGLE